MPEGRRLINGGKTNLAFPTGRMKTNDYQDLLDTHLLPFGEAIGGPVWIFQQNNATIHVANFTWEWFLQNGIHIMDWPANSPDEPHGELGGHIMLLSMCRWQTVY